MGGIELSVMVGVVLLLVQVVWPQLCQVPWRAQQAEVKSTLNAAATGARAHFLATGSYRCGSCDATLPAHPRYTYLWGPQPQAQAPCARLALAQSAQQSADVFVATAVRALGARLCEVWRITAHSPLRRQVVALPAG